MANKIFSVKIPLLNPNEPEARLVSLAVEEGQHVKAGDTLCTLETTKSTADLTAEHDGFVKYLVYSEGELVKAGAQLCFLSEDESWQPDAGTHHMQAESGEEIMGDLPAGLRISKPALVLAESNDIDLKKLPIGPLVTEQFVRELIDISEKSEPPDLEYNTQKLIVYGGGGHGKSVIDLIRANGVYQLHGIIDDGIKPGTSILGVTVLGGKELLPELSNQGIRLAVNAVGGIGDITSRISVFQSLSKNGFAFPAVNHPSAVIEPSAIFSSGVQVFPQAYVGSEANIGFGVIINTGAIISHECRLADYANISPGAVLAGDVEIGQGSLIGMGVTINLGVTIGENSRIGNSATIKSDVPDSTLIRAGSVWPE